MTKWVELESGDNKFVDWSTEQLWDHFNTEVVGHHYVNNQRDWHTWLEMIHRSDVIRLESRLELK